MAIGVIKFSKRGRRILTLMITFINLMQIIIGLLLFIVGIYVARSVGPKIFSERAEITYVFTVITMFGVSVIVQYIIGLNICYKCYLKAHKKSTSSLLFIWSIAACNTIVNGMVLATLAIKTSKHIVRSIRHSLKRGINKYLVDLTWKYTLDILQQHSECCGITSNKDWITNSWILSDFVNESNDIIKSAQKSESGIYLPVYPWSCCKMNYPLPCFHDQYQQKESLSVFKTNPDITENSLYNVGCLDILREPIENGLIIVVLADTSLLLLQILAMFMLRLLFTSSKNAVILEDEDGVAPGWLIGPKEADYASTLLKIMNINIDEARLAQDVTTEEFQVTGIRMPAGKDDYELKNYIYSNLSQNDSSTVKKLPFCSPLLIERKSTISNSKNSNNTTESDVESITEKRYRIIKKCSEKSSIVQKLEFKKNPNGSILIIPFSNKSNDDCTKTEECPAAKLTPKYKTISIFENKINKKGFLKSKKSKLRVSKKPVENEDEIQLLLQ